MKRQILILTLVAAFVLPGSYLWAGEVEPTSEKLTVGGHSTITAVWRDRLWDSVINNPYKADLKTDAFVDVSDGLDFNFDFAHEVSFFLQLENIDTQTIYGEGRLGTAALGTGGTYGTTGNRPGAGANTVVNSDFGGREILLSVEQGYISAENFLYDGLAMKAGLFDVVYDPFGKGAFFLDLPERYRDSFGGWELAYKSDNLTATFIVGTLVERRLRGGSIAAAGSRRNARNTTEFQHARVEYDFGDGAGKAFGMVTHWTADTTFRARRNHGLGVGGYNQLVQFLHQNVFDLGIGAIYQINDRFHVYGEAHFQFGDAGADRMKSNISGAEADAKGWAGYVGVAGTFKDLPWKPYFDLSFWYVSGDEDGNANGVDDDEGFISHGNSGNTMFYENLDYGLGVSSNYMKFQLCWGITPPEWLSGGLDFEGGYDFTLAFYKANSTDKFQDNTREGLTRAAAGTPRDASDDMGIELDMKKVYQITEDLTVIWGSAYVFGAEFIQENYTTANSQFGGWAGRTRDGERNGQMSYFIVELEF